MYFYIQLSYASCLCLYLYIKIIYLLEKKKAYRIERGGMFMRILL